MPILEKACARSGNSKTPIEQIPAFRNDLQREGLRNLADWERRHGKLTDTIDAVSINLQVRRHALQAKR